MPIIGILVISCSTDKLYILDQMEHHFPRLWVKKFGIHLKKIISALGNYLKAEAILILISFVIVLIGLYIFKFMNLGVQYPLLAALAIGFVDALPILRIWHSNDSLGNYSSNKWKYNTRNSFIYIICYYNGNKTINRT